MARPTSRRPIPRIPTPPAARRIAAFWAPPLLAIAALVVVSMLPAVFAQPGIVRACWTAAALLTAWLVALAIQVRARARRLTLSTQLRPQHYVQACAHASIYIYWGMYWGEVTNAVPLIAAQLAFAYAFDMLLTWWREDRYVLGFGPFPIIFSTNLFLWFKPDWFYLQFLMVAVGFAAKALIRWTREGRRVHVFNPSSFALALFSVGLLATGRSDITWGPDIAVTQLMPPHMYLLIFLVALPGQYLFGVASMTLAAVATTLVFTTTYYATTGGHYFIEPSIPIAVFLGMHLLFTDPATAPRTEFGRLLFGVLYASSVILSLSILHGAGLPGFYDKLLFVPVLNLLVPAIDRAVRAREMAGADPRLPGRSELPARTRHLRYMAVWTAVFVLMLSLTRDHVALARADVFAALNRTDDAITQYETLRARHPRMPHVDGKLGLALLRVGRLREAAAALQGAAADDPDQAAVQTNLGLVWMQLGRVDAAAAAFRRAVKLDPRNPESRYNLAQLLLEQGRTGDAAAELREALRLRPEWPTAMGALAWLQTQADDTGSSAQATLALAVRAAELSGHNDPAILDALGAAYASVGDLAHAIHAVGRAIEVAKRRAPHLLAGLQARLAGYQTRKLLVNDVGDPHTAQP